MNKTKSRSFIDGDFHTTDCGPCKYHCSPTCHPVQTMGSDWSFGCTHPAWPQNRQGDFVPIVDCEGLISKCELKGDKKFVMYYRNGLRRRVDNAFRKGHKLKKELEELEIFTSSALELLNG